MKIFIIADKKEKLLRSSQTSSFIGSISLFLSLSFHRNEFSNDEMNLLKVDEVRLIAFSTGVTLMRNCVVPL